MLKTQVEQRSTVTLNSKRTVCFLGGILIVLVVAHIVVLLMKYVFGHHYVYGLVPFFYLDAEQNAPTFFSSFLFLTNSILFLCVWKVDVLANKRRKIWLFLSSIFIFLAIDEFAILHEYLGEPVKLALDTKGFLNFAWIIPYGIAVVLLSMFVIPVLLKMDKKPRFLIGLSAVVYLSGAIGFESISGWYYDLTRDTNLVYALITTVEETLEMAGLVILTYALLMLIQNKCGEFVIRIRSASD